MLRLTVIHATATSSKRYRIQTPTGIYFTPDIEQAKSIFRLANWNIRIARIRARCRHAN